jgi:hypothetical protein
MSIFGWIDVSKSTEWEAAGAPPQRFTLAGPVARPDPLSVPLRGDLAHIGLAGRYFVPHYLAPLLKLVGARGAKLRAGPNEEAEIIRDLPPRQRFELLDAERGWAWGCLGLEGPVGYVKADDLMDPAP